MAIISSLYCGPEMPWHLAFSNELCYNNFDAAISIILPHVNALYKDIPPLALSEALHPSQETDILKRRKSLRAVGRELLALLHANDGRLAGKSSVVSYSKALNCLVPIAILPIEILVTIFQELAINHIKHLFNAALVCSPWRELINGTPHLWTTIVSDRAPAHFLQAAFVRSAGYPVNVAITSRQAAVGKVLQSNPQFAPQLHSAVLCLGDAKSGLGPLRQAFSFPKLQELRVTANKPRKPKSPSSELEPQTLFGMREGDRFPALRVLHLDTVCPIATDTDLICEGVQIGLTLERLVITSVILTFDAIDVLLKDCPNLIDLELVNCKTRANRGITKVSDMRQMKQLKLLSLIKCDAVILWHALLLIDASKLETFLLNVPGLTDKTVYPSRDMRLLRTDDMSMLLLRFLTRSARLTRFDIKAPSWVLVSLSSRLRYNTGTNARPLLPLLTRLTAKCRDLDFVSLNYKNAQALINVQKATSENLRDFVMARNRPSDAARAAHRRGRLDYDSSLCLESKSISSLSVLERVCISQEYIEAGGREAEATWYDAKFAGGEGIKIVDGEGMSELFEVPVLLDLGASPESNESFPSDLFEEDGADA